MLLRSHSLSLSASSPDARADNPAFTVCMTGGGGGGAGERAKDANYCQKSHYIRDRPDLEGRNGAARLDSAREETDRRTDKQAGRQAGAR